MVRVKNTSEQRLLYVHCVLVVVTFLWVVSPLIQFSQSFNSAGLQTEWIFDLTEDERGGEKETEKDKTDDEEKTQKLARLESERVARDAMLCIVRLNERLEDGPAIERPGQPPRV